nr:protein cft1 [Quercus suber]
MHQPFGPSLSECPAMLTVDPSSRCAALKFGVRHLAILPFRQLGDDLAEGVDDGDLDMDPVELPLKRASSQTQGEGEAAKQTPYKPSFVLPLTVLDPSLVHLTHLAFLHEYREPTFGFLSSSIQPSAALLADRKDCLNYTVLTLDLDQRASTNLVTVTKLPSDLWKIVPLALPVGGALLIGNNEFVHIDQSGKTAAVAVNEFARQASDFNMADHANLNMKLENCEIAVLDSATGDLLIVLDDGALATLTFKLLGRNVGGILVTRVDAECGGRLFGSGPSALTVMRNNSLFVGSEDGESALFAWNKKGSSSSRKRSHAQMVDGDVPNDENGDADEIDEDDLYATAKDSIRRPSSPSMQGISDVSLQYSFERHDMLKSLGPINSLCLGKSPSHGKDRLQLVAASGRGRTSLLTCFNREIVPTIGKTTPFTKAQNAWAMRALSRDGNISTVDEGEHHDNLLFVFDGESTKIYDIPRPGEGSGAFTERTGTEFEHDGETLAVATLSDRKTVVQCRRTEVRTYNAELNLSSIIPMYAEDGDAELRIVATSLWNQYMLVLRDDSSVQILKFDNDGDAEPLVEEDMAIAERKWLSGCLYTSLVSHGEPCIYLLGQEGGLHIYSIPELKLCYQAPSLTQLPPVLSTDGTLRRGGGKATLTELLVTDLGDGDHTQPFLVVRSSMDDLTLYEPFRYDAVTPVSSADFTALRFRKVPCQHLPRYDEALQNTEDDRPAALQPLLVNGYSVIYVPGSSPSMVIKDAKNLPKVINIRASKVNAITTLNYKHCMKGFALVTSDGTLNEHVLPDKTSYGSGWSVSSVHVGEPFEEIRHVAFHEERQVYAVATCRNVDFVFPEDDDRHPDQDGMLHFPSQFANLRYYHETTSSPIHTPLTLSTYPYCYTSYGSGWSVSSVHVGEPFEEIRHVAFHEERQVYAVATCRNVDFVFPEDDDRHPDQDASDITMRPQVPQYTLHLLSARTLTVISSLEMPYSEQVTSLKVMKLEYSEQTHEQRYYVVVGTDAQRGEDMPAKGAVTVFDIIEVVPEPERPESGLKLHTFAREETKGAVTAVESFPGGLVGIVQGQKVMIRGLKEDGSCLPVAFLDALCHMTTLKSLGRSGLWLLGDVCKGLWFGGYTQEPYKLTPLGKSQTQMEVMVAEFLPFDQNLFIVIVDADTNMHVLQYDPENPRSMSGTRLLERSTFHLGHFPTSLTLVPSTLAPFTQQNLSNGHDEASGVEGSESPQFHHVLTTTQTGSIGLVTALDETTYRRLGALQTQLSSMLEHAAGLNPRAFRTVADTEGTGARVGVIDGNLIQRIAELGSQKRNEVLGRAGGDVWGLRSDLEIIGGGGLDYL